MEPTPIGDSIMKNIIGFVEWQMRWNFYHEAKINGIPGLSGKEEQDVIESLRPDRHINPKPTPL